MASNSEAQTGGELPEKYTDGVWYDAETDEFYRISEAGGTVVLAFVLEDEEHEVDMADFRLMVPDLEKVPENAARNPANFFRTAVLRELVDIEMGPGFEYARQASVTVNAEDQEKFEEAVDE